MRLPVGVDERTAPRITAVTATPAYVAVVGPGEEATAGDVAAASTVGRLLAERGVVVLTGGLGGVMAAASAAAAAAGGVVVGLLPGDRRGAANPDVTIAVPTGLGQARNAVVATAADGVLAVGGSWGTLSEIALARRMGRPVVTLGGWRLTDAGGSAVELSRAASPEDAVATLLAEITSGRTGGDG